MLYEKVLEMGNVDFTDTSTFTREQWLELRRTGSGGRKRLHRRENQKFSF